jgi:glycosyltransferase involved in cell wall biosynthesis
MVSRLDWLNAMSSADERRSKALSVVRGRGHGLNGQRVTRFTLGILTRVVLMVVYGSCLRFHTILGAAGKIVGRAWRSRESSSDQADLLVIGTFYTRNWCTAHLSPLARVPGVRKVYAVVDGPVEALPNVVYVHPPRWMVCLCGRAVSKFFTALGLALEHRPVLVMGYHLFPNALTALLTAAVVGARSVYQATGGPNELIGGGWQSENVLVKKLAWPAPQLEAMVRAVVRRFDVIVVRGQRARRYMIETAAGRNVQIIPGSIRTHRFCSAPHARSLDVVWVGRLVPIKQPEQILAVLAEVKRRRGRLKAVIVGDGPLLEPMRRRSDEVALSEDVLFAGYIEDVERVLTDAKVFLLTSRSEGLSIAMAEAMAAGAVPVVPDVGDLGELVRTGETGWLIDPGKVSDYADRICALLDDAGLWTRVSAAARQAARDLNDVSSVARRWEALISVKAVPRTAQGAGP